VNAVAEACVDVHRCTNIKENKMQTNNIKCGTMEKGVGALRLMQWHSAVIAEWNGLRTRMCKTSMLDLSGGEQGDYCKTSLQHYMLSTLSFSEPRCSGGFRFLTRIDTLLTEHTSETPGAERFRPTDLDTIDGDSPYNAPL
jgi:hypothetical protein